MRPRYSTNLGKRSALAKKEKHWCEIRERQKTVPPPTLSVRPVLPFQQEANRDSPAESIGDAVHARDVNAEPNESALLRRSVRESPRHGLAVEAKQSRHCVPDIRIPSSPTGKSFPASAGRSMFVEIGRNASVSPIWNINSPEQISVYAEGEDKSMANTLRLPVPMRTATGAGK